jgi:ferredoxin
MALQITESCTFCGACEPECPVNAISAGDDTYVIDATTCTECVGHSDTPACVGVCPTECIVEA